MVKKMYIIVIILVKYGTTSPDWQIGPGGSKIPETFVESPKHCNTGAPGWLNGTHPTIQYETVRTVCFYHIGENKCHWETAIQIRNCGDY